MAEDRKVALVTGASRGIGCAIARRLADRGLRVALHCRTRRAEAEAVRDELAGSGHEVFLADLGEADACVALVQEAAGRMGRLDVLVNNAGIYAMHRVLEVDFDTWRRAWERTLAVNLLGPAHLMYAAARRMAAAGGGRIVNVSSRGAFRGEPEAPAYGAAKAGLNAASQSLAQALAPHGVFVGVVAPGWVQTDMAAPHLDSADGEGIRNPSPLGRVARPEEIAGAVAFLACDAGEYLTGCIIDANGASYLRT